MAKIVLSVEGDDSVYRLLQMAFEEVGNDDFELARASDGELALAFLKRLAPFGEARRPDLILLNLNLPRVDGFEVLEAIRRDEHLNDIPVVVFTSSNMDSDRSRCLALGAKDFMAKPNDFDTLVDAVKTACAHAG